MTFIVECHSEATGWLPYARADNIEEARMKAANAFIKTRHTVVRITEERQMKEIIIVFYLLVVFITSMYLFENTTWSRKRQKRAYNTHGMTRRLAAMVQNTLLQY